MRNLYFNVKNVDPVNMETVLCPGITYLSKEEECSALSPSSSCRRTKWNIVLKKMQHSKVDPPMCWDSTCGLYLWLSESNILLCRIFKRAHGKVQRWRLRMCLSHVSYALTITLGRKWSQVRSRCHTKWLCTWIWYLTSQKILVSRYSWNFLLPFIHQEAASIWRW